MLYSLCLDIALWLGFDFAIYHQQSFSAAAAAVIFSSLLLFLLLSSLAKQLQSFPYFNLAIFPNPRFRHFLYFLFLVTAFFPLLCKYWKKKRVLPSVPNSNTISAISCASRLAPFSTTSQQQQQQYCITINLVLTFKFIVYIFNVPYDFIATVEIVLPFRSDRIALERESCNETNGKEKTRNRVSKRNNRRTKDSTQANIYQRQKTFKKGSNEKIIGYLYGYQLFIQRLCLNYYHLQVHQLSVA